MITERDEEQRDERRTLGLSVVASVIVNIVAWMLVIWSAGIQLAIVPKIEEPKYLIASSSIRIEHRTVPQPPNPQTRNAPQRAAAAAKAASVREPQQERRPQPSPPPAEVARVVQHAPPQQQVPHPAHHAASLESQLQAQEQQFAREAQALNAQHRTISIATSPPEPASAQQRSFMDLSGRDRTESVQALLEPLPGQHWIANGMSCYYVHYYAQYSGGGSEDGNIPWPLCYPVAHDAMLPLDHAHRLPIPSPPTGYVLPPNTTLPPLLESIYTGEIYKQHG